MELRKNARLPCPPGIIAIAINDDKVSQHCGIAYTDDAGHIALCDMQWENTLAVRTLPPQYFWAAVRLKQSEVFLLTEFIQLIIDQNNTYPVRYSFVYEPDGFEATGQLRNGVGITCATFVVAIFDRLKLKVVDLGSWKARPERDGAFRKRIISMAIERGQTLFAARLMTEKTNFRLSPWELCACATHRRYPVKFCQAKKLAKIAMKLIRKDRKANAGEQP